MRFTRSSLASSHRTQPSVKLHSRQEVPLTRAKGNDTAMIKIIGLTAAPGTSRKKKKNVAAAQRLKQQQLLISAKVKINVIELVHHSPKDI